VKSKKTLLAAGIFFLVLILCWRGFPTVQQKILPTADWMKPLDSTWVLQSPGKPYSIEIASDMKKNGEDSLRFELRSGERWVDQFFLRTFRAEIATKEFPPAGSAKWYSFSVFFPTNFTIEDNRLVFAQWKEKEAFLGKGLSPSLAFRFVNGKFSITLRHSDETVIRDADAVPSESLFKKSNFSLGQWHDFVVQAKWSYKDDGFVNIWWNGKQIVEYHGPVGYDEKLGPQFKFGLYRDATEAIYIAYFNHVKFGDDPKDVDFDPSTGR
jgi:hypothetical protein